MVSVWPALLWPKYFEPTFFWGWALGLLALMQILTAACKRSRIFASQPMVAAYDLTALVPVVALSWLGLRMQLGDSSVHEITMRSSAFVVDTPHLIMLQVAYQVFATVASVLVGPPLLTRTMIAHHIATGLTAWLSLQGHCMYYAIYFAGVVELTNIPLTFMDLCRCRRPRLLDSETGPTDRSLQTPSPRRHTVARLVKRPVRAADPTTIALRPQDPETPIPRDPPRRYFPELEQRHPGVSTAARFSFSLGFLALRVLGWLPVCLMYLRDLQALAPDEPLVVGVMATTAVIISGLQLFWGCKVVRGLADAVLGCSGGGGGGGGGSSGSGSRHRHAAKAE